MLKVDWDTIPDDNTLPSDIYELEIESIEKGASRAGNLMYTGTFRVAEGSMKGVAYFERFNIGTPDDPNALDAKTQATSMGLKALKKVFKASGQPFVGDLDEMCHAVAGSHVVTQIEQRVETKEGPYKGRVYNQATRWWKPGERSPGTGVTSASASRSVSAEPTVTLPDGRTVSRSQYAKMMLEQQKD